MGLVKNYSEQHRSRRLHRQTRDNSASQTEERGRGRELHHKYAGAASRRFSGKKNMKRAHKSHARFVKHVASDK